MILYVAPALLRATRATAASGATGTLVWISRTAPRAGCLPTVQPALLVQTIYATRQEAYVELVPHVLTDDPLRSHVALVLQTAFAAADAASRLYAAALADALAVHFLRRYMVSRLPTPMEAGGLCPAKLQRIATYIQAHLAQELSLTTLATLVHLSPDHFARLFKHAMGQTPHQYVLWCRIERAKQLLAETDVPLNMIGLEVGCTDHSAFTALFRKHVAMPPNAYRAATQRT
jgi:AraC family transcriptional regulator